MADVGHEVIDCVGVSVLHSWVGGEELSHVNIPERGGTQRAAMGEGTQEERVWVCGCVTHLMGKLTIVGFFSTKKLFFVNL